MLTLKQIYEAQLSRLEQDAIRGFPGTKKRQNIMTTVNVSNLQYVPYVQSNTLEIKAVAKTAGGTYHPSIMITDVEFHDEDTPDVATFQGSDGQEYHMTPVSKTVHNCTVVCDCMDFRWRFSMTNYNDDSLLGNPPPPYIRKTTTRPPVNPLSVIGLCKHLFRLVDNLEANRIIRP